MSVVCDFVAVMSCGGVKAGEVVLLLRMRVLLRF